jgi:filamentous hemagglutinin
MDPMWKNSGNIKRLVGIRTLLCHGDKTGFSYLDLNGNEINMTPRDFAEILKNSPVYDGQPIRLISCEAGADGSITAQYYGKSTRVPVLAPTDIVYVYPDGVMKVGKYNTGRWVLFNPKER